MTGNDTAKSAIPHMGAATILLAVIYLLPASSPFGFGWVIGLLPLPVFYFLTILGEKRSLILFRNSLIIAGLIALVSHSLHSFIFALTMAPVGYSLHKSVLSGDDYLVAGAKGVIVLGTLWLGFWLIIGVTQGVNPYSQLLKMLDETFAQTHQIYSTRSDIPADTILQLEEAVKLLRETIPKILPGILSGMILLTIWANLVFANRILHRLQAVTSPWPPFYRWRLPETFIWIVISSAIVLMVASGKISNLGLNILIVMSLLYLFQGLAIMIFYLEKWSVPRFLKFVLYGLLALQSYGLVVLVFLGLADVWLDIRKLKHEKTAS